MSRQPTKTSAFGVSRRESHDPSGFYSRFAAPILSTDATVNPQKAVDKLILGDAREMSEVPDASVGLVVTSPPYFAGKVYESGVGQGGVPATYFEYLQLLRDVFAECVRKLEPGGRIAVNVANLGRRPYRSLSADVIGILQDDLGLLLRGEVVWMKQRGSSGSCAWGSFQKAANPVLRDTTERVIVASKGRFDRAIPTAERARLGLPHVSSMSRDDFLENTIDVWEIPAESATRIGHPAPFPVELVSRLISLYTYRGDLILDPFLGSGTTAVAALQAERHYVGYDQDDSYIRLAEERVARQRRDGIPLPDMDQAGEAVPWVSKNRSAKDIARGLIEAAGFGEIRANERRSAGTTVSFSARDANSQLWLFEVAGSFTSQRSGLRKSDLLWRALAKAAVLHETGDRRLVVLTPELPPRRSATDQALMAVTGPGKPIHAVVAMGDPSSLPSLRVLCAGGNDPR